MQRRGGRGRRRECEDNERGERRGDKHVCDRSESENGNGSVTVCWEEM